METEEFNKTSEYILFTKNCINELTRSLYVYKVDGQWKWKLNAEKSVCDKVYKRYATQFYNNMIGKSGIISYAIQTDKQQELHDEHLNEILETAYTCARIMSRDCIRKKMDTSSNSSSMQVEFTPTSLKRSQMSMS